MKGNKNMKMTLNEALVLNNIVKALIDNKTLRIDSFFKFKLLCIAKELAPFAENYQVIRNDKIKEYGTEVVDEEGNPTGGIEIKEEDTSAREKFNKDMEDFVNQEIEVSISKLKVREAMDSGVPADYLIHLFNIIEE